MTLHGGAELTLNTMRSEYWILKGKQTVKKVLHSCLTCYRYKAQGQQQLMGVLPSYRVNVARPFQHTGVDYAGPVLLKMSQHRQNRLYKGYICIFICMATKAVHLEAVSDLTTNAYLAAFKRFISRRGICSNLYSDCGRTFIGANKYLTAEVKTAIKTSIHTAAEHCATKAIRWHFNPPATPHFGGLWEAGVKSVKYHLKRVFGTSSLTFEELTTTLCQIETCLNSRPLCPLSNDPDDDEALTPGHFLVGTPLLQVPESPTMSPMTLRKRWDICKQLQYLFWKKWVSHYINQLQNRPKWKLPSQNIKEDDLVLIKEENLPPCTWLLGRVTKVHTGSDSRVRVVTLRTKNGTFTRPVTKICLIPSE